MAEVYQGIGENGGDHPEGVNASVDHGVDECRYPAMDQDSDDPIGQDQAAGHGLSSSMMAEVSAKKWPGWPGESVFRLLVPAQKVGSIIGRKGEFIKKIVEESKARIKILDGPAGTTERVVLVSAKEEPHMNHPPAIDGLLKVHRRIIDGLQSESYSAPVAKVSTRLLVPASQAGSLIGKQGGTVKSIQEEADCMVRILGAEALPIFALEDDKVVDILGDSASVHKAVELVASNIRKFLVDRSVIPIFEAQMQMASTQAEHVSAHQSWGAPAPQAFSSAALGGPAFGPSSQYLASSRDNFFSPDLPSSMEKQPHQGISAYGREASGAHQPPNTQTPSSMITQVTQQMQISLSYADAVIGTAGASISYIRRASGATVTIQETRGVPGEMTVEISGTASQVQTAQQLIQNFMAEAAPQNQTQGAGMMDPAFNPYAAHGSMYASPASNPSHAGTYGGTYGTNYGY